MRRLKIPGLILLLAVAVIYVGLKAYLYFSVKAQLDDTVARARAFAAVSYSGISSNLLEGHLAVDGIEVRTAEQTFPLRIGSIALEGPGPIFLLDLASGFSGKDLPSWMHLILRRVELPDIRSMLPLAAVAALPASVYPTPCSLGDILGRAGLLNSDRFPLSVNASMRYELNAPLRSARVEFTYDIDDGESIMLDMALSNLSRSAAMTAGALPSVERLSYSYQANAELIQKLVGQCAADKGQASAEFVDALLAQPERRLLKQLGFIPGPGLAAAIKGFLLSPGEILIAAGPIDDMALLQQAAQAPERWVSVLNLRVSLNGKRIQDLSYRTKSRSSAQGKAEAGSLADEEDGAVAKRPRPDYFETPLSQLHKYLGRKAHLFERGQTDPHFGVLVSVRDDEASVEKRVHGGKFTVHVPFDEISRIEVWRYAEPIE